MQKKAAKPPAKTAKKKKTSVKRQDQLFSLKRLIMGEEKPDLTGLEAGPPGGGRGRDQPQLYLQAPAQGKILSKIAQTTMVNRFRMRDVDDIRQNFEELDSAISSGLYLKDAINRQGEDFYYMHTLIEVTAEDT